MGGAARGAKGGRLVALPWGRPEGRAGAGGAISRNSSPAAPPPQLPERSPPPRGPLPARDAGCAGMCQDARRCRRGPGPRRGRVTEEAKPGAGSSMPPSLGEQPSLPRARAGLPEEPGVGSLSTPRSHRLSSALPRSPVHASAPPPPGLPPEWEGAAVPPPCPFPPRPRAGALGFPHAYRPPRRPTDADA